MYVSIYRIISSFWKKCMHGACGSSIFPPWEQWITVIQSTTSPPFPSHQLGSPRSGHVGTQLVCRDLRVSPLEESRHSNKSFKFFVSVPLKIQSWIISCGRMGPKPLKHPEAPNPGKVDNFWATSSQRWCSDICGVGWSSAWWCLMIWVCSSGKKLGRAVSPLKPTVFFACHVAVKS